MQKAIEKLGLTDKETHVYMASLELGEASITDIAKRSGLKRTTAHLAAGQLIMLGLLSETIKGKRRVVAPVHPRRLLELARLRASQIEDNMGELVALYNLPKEKPKIQVFEGQEGMRALYHDLYQSLNNKEEALWFTRIDALNLFPEVITEHMNLLRRLRNPKMRELNYDNPAGRKWAQDIKPFQGKNHFIRLLPAGLEFGFCDNLIFQNRLVIFSLKKDLFVTMIESEEIVKTYRALFEAAWKQGKQI